ncbi:MAG: DUF87 domain-containing protein [Pirellulaceae bacterium]|nr:DUF87 domain-containing protein [Pirellulaceae bacterium]
MSADQPSYESLGSFYLGKSFNLDSNRREEELVLYDSKDLVTHAVIVGMTGSGKTGLGVGLLEEAAIDRIPALIIDPKGDLSNLLLNFPELRPEDFLPWIHADDAQREQMTVEDYAAMQASRWREGLADWDQTPERISRLGDAVEFNVYTPGSDAGLPISILSSFAAPPPSVVENADLLRDRVTTTANSLLGLLGINADPLRSREHILITRLLDESWRSGKDLDLGQLIQQVQQPPFQQVGVMDLESFFPPKDRFELAMALNNLLAAPSFAAWLKGQPLNVDQLLYSPSGKPRHSIFSIAHLSESERMFFVSLLLNETLGWMRSRSGTNSLRALLYIDEIFGYMPPVAEPPSKKPLLTLLKQARAFGLGVVLSTQNPVDLDYKGLSNAGTWFLGRLQTERDKDRVLDGLEGATTESGEAFDRSTAAEILSNVGKRVFLMHNVHDSAPEVFQTRWALSYLAGPMTRNQIRSLMKSKQETAEKVEPSSAGTTDKTPPDRPTNPIEHASGRSAASPHAPVVPRNVESFFLPSDEPNHDTFHYSPQILAFIKVHFVDTRRGLAADDEYQWSLQVPVNAVHPDWDTASVLQMNRTDLRQAPLSPCTFEPLPNLLSKSSTFSECKKSLRDFLYRQQRYDLFKCATLKEYSRPGESERDFRIRLTDLAREARDGRVDKLRHKYASRLQTAEDRINRAEEAIEREASQAKEANMRSMISLGSNLLSAMLGKKKFSSTNIGRASRTAQGFGRASKQAEDVRRAERKAEEYRNRLADLEADFRAEAAEIREQMDPLKLELETIQLKPRKSDIDIRLFAIVWIPTPKPGN